ncbi:hypothetical protein Q0V21_19425 [Paenibacillus sp. 11B]|uniref:hypothetical protein n=2 Tax=Bacilli TaxID=91061 RepID=UPI00265634D9|nr:hypothetical protein [Paenibacillus sp. 11B]MDN8590933.1 hypothetical protein [Paenibacillus sp. 11B]
MAGIVTQEVVKEFLDRMHLDDEEDGNLLRILKASNDDLVRVCGDYDIQTHEVFKELVFERSRYVYNDALEYFNINFLTQINNLMLDKALSEVDADEGQ